MHITFFSFITRMYIFIFGSVFTFFPNIYCAWSLNGISRHFIIISKFINSPHPHPTPYPPPKKTPRKTKNIHLCHWLWFFFFYLNSKQQELHSSFCCFFFLITWLSFNYIYIFEICISIVTEEEIITFIKKIENGKI